MKAVMADMKGKADGKVINHGCGRALQIMCYLNRIK